MAPEPYDVVVVGARCAGAPLATFLARAGLSVALLDRATFPSDTLSTHVFWPSGVAVLGRLGVVDRLLGSGAPWLADAVMRVDDVWARLPWPTEPDDPGPGLCVRRPVLDTLLVEAAADAGATVCTGTRVTGLVHRDGRVGGVVAETADRSLRLEAPLVVGADGRASTVGRLVGARSYNVVPNERFGYWAYYEGAAQERPAAIRFLRWDDELVIACPCDAGLYMVAVLASLDRLDAFLTDVPASYDALVARCEPLAELLSAARRVDRPRGTASYSGWFRQSAGPGWALVGDAGHFKEPTPGQGISDALRQAEHLSGVIVDAWSGGAGPPPPRDLDRVLARWWRWRDRDAREMHWFAQDLGAAGPVPAVFVEMLRRMASRPDGLRPALDIFNHRVRPSEVLTPVRLAGGAARAVARGRPPGQVAREVRTIVSRDLRRRWRNHFPRYAGPSPAGEPDAAAPSLR